MDYRPPSDIYLQVALWAGIGTIVLTVLVGLQIVWLRFSMRRLQRREQALTLKWRPLLNAAIAGDELANLPELARRDQVLFIKLWLHLQQAVRGEASEGLNRIARRVGCDAYMRKLLVRGNRAERLLATLALGHMRDKASWEPLARAAHAADSASSVHALWALVQTDAARSAQEMAPVLLRRDDWPLSQLANILQNVRGEWQLVLALALLRVTPEELPQALRLVAALRIDLPLAQLKGYLASDQADVVLAALRLARSPAVLEQVRGHLGSADWRIRLQAVRALGELGDRSDVDRLRALLSDPEWWVRYRAAEALLSLPFLTEAELADLRNADDRYAADMLKQVAAEREVA
ncbi:HEAT repeat domain-containing protein [Pseudoduganella eburnea]|uniref:HEAT repeat domain-containing protein n=1 Tax=Massilia eburnea TaxID=1776165 RepID=A0A6L6QMG0_9BURK|nr:HEAT repeat domain-containing protein [Massilia eburnea]MTW13345.1 HEAT repeat domain-containing protein [Massilia eburnea]